MDYYWVCPECLSVNLYPDITECEVCGQKIGEKEIRRVRQKMKEDAERILREEKEKKAQEALRRQQENAERKRAEAERRQAERENRIRAKKAKRAAAFRKYTKAEEKFFSAFGKLMAFVRRALAILLVLYIAASVIFAFAPGNDGDIPERARKAAVTAVQELRERHFTVNKNGEVSFAPMENIEKRYEYLKKSLAESDNIQSLFNVSGW